MACALAAGITGVCFYLTALIRAWWIGGEIRLPKPLVIFVIGITCTCMAIALGMAAQKLGADDRIVIMSTLAAMALLPCIAACCLVRRKSIG